MTLSAPQVMPDAEVRSVGAMVLKRLNRNGRRTHRSNLLTRHACYGDIDIDAFPLASTACCQGNPQEPDDKKLRMFHRTLPPQARPDTCARSSDQTRDYLATKC